MDTMTTDEILDSAAHIECAYCTRTAYEADTHGYPACEGHAAMDDAYEIVTDLDPATSAWLDAAMARRVEKLLAAEGWDVTIREGRGDEAHATYLHQHGRSLQILGYSIPVPEMLAAAIEDAANRVLGGEGA